MSSLLERVFVIGGEGQLGRDLCAIFGDGLVAAPPHAELDLENAQDLDRALHAERPTLVVNAAAYHNVERCEEFPDRAFAVNAEAVGRLADQCAHYGAALATFSTDYVFDGRSRRPYRERDEARPLNVYGRSKLEGERLVEKAGAAHFIVRTSGLYGHYPSRVKGYTFVDLMLGRGEAGEQVRVVNDIVFSPSYAPHVARALHMLVAKAAYGTFHVSNRGAASWYDVTAEAFRLANIPVPPQAIGSEEFPSKVERPKYSVFAHEAMKNAGLPDMPDWKTGLAEYVGSRKAREIPNVRA